MTREYRLIQIDLPFNNKKKRNRMDYEATLLISPLCTLDKDEVILVLVLQHITCTDTNLIQFYFTTEEDCCIVCLIDR